MVAGAGSAVGVGSAAAVSAVAPPPSPVSPACRHCANSRIRRLEMSSIIPPRPKRARRPVIVKSVTASTRVPSSVSNSLLTIVAFAPPWPRLSLPFALSVAVCVASSASSMLDLAAVGRGRRAELDLERAVIGALVVALGDRRAGKAGRHALEIDEHAPHLIDRR